MNDAERSDHSPEPAVTADLDAVVGLIQAAGLPTAGIGEAFPAAYSVVRAGSSVVAVAGLEVHGEVGLLRSVAVTASQRGTGLGRRLVEDRLTAAKEQRLEAVYLLTTTAADFFRSAGFQDADRATAPPALQRSSEFAATCPSTATCLVKRLP